MKRILALAVSAAVLAGGGVALAAANGHSKSNQPAASTGSSTTKTPRSQQATPHNCPNSGSGSSSNTSLDL